jgi:16S rRNA processing protein RimM
LSEGQRSPAGLIGLGRVTAVQGLRGALKIGAAQGAEPTDPGVIAALGEVEIEGRRFQVRAVARQKRHLLLSLEGIDTREQAELLVGREVRGEAGRFPPLPPGEYYWFQLLGLPVRHAADQSPLGRLAEIIPTPGHDVYVVRQGERELLLPAVEEVILEINLEEGWIKVLPPPGLMDADAD